MRAWAVRFVVTVVTFSSLAQPLAPLAIAATCPSFTPLAPVASAGLASDVAVGEFTGDAIPDVAVANLAIGLNRVSSLRNDGQGTLSLMFNNPAGNPPTSLGQNGVAVGDFDEDGRLDLVVIKLWENVLTLMVDDTFGKFRPHVSFPTGARPFDVAVGDFDGDDNLDAVVTNFSSNSAFVYFGDGTGVFPVVKSVAVGAFPTAVAVGDLDLDGIDDIVVTDDSGANVVYGGTARSLPKRAIPVPDIPTGVAVTRMNGDLFPDIVVAGSASPTVRVLVSLGVSAAVATSSGSPLPFSVGTAVQTGSTLGATIRGLRAGDLTGDDLADVAVLVGNGGLLLPAGEPAVRILSGNGNGGLTASASVELGRDPEAIKLEDMTGDGGLDLIVADASDGIYVATNACPPAVPLDLEATGIEVVQVVQDLANSVPLIESKRTVVRGYVNATRTTPGVTARLVRLDAVTGTEIGYVLPINPVAKITVKDSPSRGLPNDSFRFELPEPWTHGALRLRFDVNPGGAPHELTMANNSFTGSVTFGSARTLKVTLVDYRWALCGPSDVVNVVECKPGAASIGFTDPLPETEYPLIEADLRRKLPVANVRVKRVEVKDAETILPKNTSPIPGAVELNQVIALRQGLQSSDPGTIFIWLNRNFVGGVAYTYNPQTPERQWDVIASASGVAVHEVGHILGRGHSGCTAGEAGVDYPYPGGKIGGPAGDTEHYYGYSVPDGSASRVDFASVVLPTVGDEMGYCDPSWPSDFSYRRWRTEIEARPGFIDPTGDFLVVAGTISADGSRGTLDDVRRVPQVGTLTSTLPGAFHLRLQDASGTVLADQSFLPAAILTHQHEPELAFNEVFSWVAGTRRVAIVNAAGVELASRIVTASAPVVGAVSQNGGTTLPATGAVTVSWSGSDLDGGAPTASVLYSIDAGASWSLLATGLTSTSFTLDAASLTGTKGAATGRFRVLLSDGVQTGAADTTPFVVPGQAPTVRVATPLAGERFELGQSVMFEAVALDAEDGVLDGAGVTWSSSLSGALGNGRILVARLAEGTHAVTVTATDSDGRTASVTRSVTVARDVPLGSAPIARAGADLTAIEGATVTLSGAGSSDPDGDTLAYSWQVVASPADKVQLESSGATASFVALEDGLYTLRLTVSDGLNATVSDDVNVLVSNVAPVVAITAPTAGQLFPVGNVTVRATFSDPGLHDEHTCTVNWDIDRAGLVDIGTVDHATQTCTATRTLSAGVYTIEVRIDDGDGGVGVAQVQVVVYDPSAGFVTGGGWIQSPVGAVTTMPAITGRANFGFALRYARGATVPSGQTELQLQSARLDFHSSAYEWLVITGGKAQFKGTGTVNGAAGYSFLVTVADGKLSGGPSRFRIKIWNAAGIVYDSAPGAPDDVDAANPAILGGGSVVIHN
jgi:hypothetical protein